MPQHAHRPSRPRATSSASQTPSTTYTSTPRPPHLLPPANNHSHSSNNTPVQLTRAHIVTALSRSNDGGATLDLTQLGLTDLGEEGAEKLARLNGTEVDDDDDNDNDNDNDLFSSGQGPVVRMALGYNRLSTLPMALSLLSSIRYLNLRNNHFLAFPDVLTVMPSLEVLDMRRNKLGKFPSHPGTLVNVKVMLLARNNLSTLPLYLHTFTTLHTLDIEHNPITWPPAHIATCPPDPNLSQSWITNLKSFLSSHSVPEGGELPGWPFPPSGSKNTGEYDHEPTSGLSVGLGLEHEFEMLTTPHARSFSIDSDVSLYSDRADHDHNTDPNRDTDYEEISSPTLLPLRINKGRIGAKSTSPRPAPLDLGFLPTPQYERPTGRKGATNGGSVAGTSHSHSPSSYLPTPDASVASTEEDDSGHPGLLSHARAASNLASGSSHSPSRPPLVPKQSMPDLRTAKFSFGGAVARASPLTRSRTDLGQLPEEDTILHSRHVGGRSIASTGASPRRRGATPLGYHHPSPPSTQLTFDSSSANFTSSPTTFYPSTDPEAYFQRLSTLSSQTIHAPNPSLPPSLLTLSRSVRELLDTLSPLSTTLSTFATHVTTTAPTLAPVLTTVLRANKTHSSSAFRALERFDNASRRSTPSPATTRALCSCARNMLQGFSKALTVLGTQLKVLASSQGGTDDEGARHTRQMLLVLFGAASELSLVWSRLGPALSAVRPYLIDKHPASTGRPRVAVNTTSMGLHLHPGTGHGAEYTPDLDGPLSAPVRPSTLRSRPSGSGSSNGHGEIVAPDGGEKIRRARRHAGSFSVRDLELGRTMLSVAESPPLPSFVGMGGMFAGGPGGVGIGVSGLASPMSAGGTPTPRATMGGLPPSITHVSAGEPGPAHFGSTPTHTMGGGGGAGSANGGVPSWARTIHSRESSVAAVSTSSASSSPIARSRGRGDLHPHPQPESPSPVRPESEMEAPGSSSTSMDGAALAEVQAVLSALPPVLALVQSRVQQGALGELQVQELTTRAKVLAQRLKSKVDVLVGSGDAGTLAGTLRDDHHAFVKVILRLADLMKPFKDVDDVRNAMQKLTSASEASLMLLAVSSFPPPTKDKEKEKPTPATDGSRKLDPVVPSTPILPPAAPQQPTLAPLANMPTFSRPAPQSPEVLSPSSATLGRSRSAFAPPTRTAASAASVWANSPRSAAPHQQSFNVPFIPSSGAGTPPPRMSAFGRH